MPKLKVLNHENTAVSLNLRAIHRVKVWAAIGWQLDNIKPVMQKGLKYSDQ